MKNKHGTFEMFLANDAPEYFPGQPVSGRLHLDLTEPLEFLAITVHVYGAAEVQWSEGRINSRTRYGNKEVYINRKIYLVGTVEGKDTRSLPVGKHDIHFSTTLPNDMPQSFIGEHGQVRYYLRGNVEFEETRWRAQDLWLKVLPILDLNHEPEAFVPPSTNTGTKSLGFITKSDPINATISIAKLGYVGCETISVTAKIENNSNKPMKKCTIKLIENHIFKASDMRNTKHIERVLGEHDGGCVEAGSGATLQDVKIKLPDLAPSYLSHCTIIDINYVLELRVGQSISEKSKSDLVVPIDIVIGTIPLIHCPKPAAGAGSSAEGAGRGFVYRKSVSY